MKWMLMVALLMPVSSMASCWNVDGLKGSNYSAGDGYSRIDDGYSGKFTIMVKPNYAVVLYDGADAGGMVYRAISDRVIVGMTSEPMKNVMETWVIQNDNTVLFTKTISGYGSSDSVKAMVGRISGICE
jgi:hypothetical protein